MATNTNPITELKIDQAWFELYQKRGLYPGMKFKEYIALKTREKVVAADSIIHEATLDDVIADFKRNGSEDAQVLPKTFVEETIPESQKAYVFGYQGLVTYFARGIIKSSPNEELALISAHVPGSPGGGGWGLNGTRKLQRATKPLLGWKKEFDPDEWIARSTAWIYEDYDGKVQYNSVEKGKIQQEFMSYVRTALGA